MILHSSKITGAGAVVTLASALPAQTGQTATTPLKSKWVQAVTPPTNSAAILIGGSEVSSTVGFPIPVGWAGQLMPPIAEAMEFYDHSLINVYVAAGDVLHILYGG